ncbi:MAG: metallophosphoesterase [Myxococcota bacterium]
MPVLMRLVFLTIVSVVSYGLHLFLFSRVAQMLSDAAVMLPQSILETASGKLLVLELTFSVLTLSYFTIGTMLHPRQFRWLGWLSGAWMGALTLLCLWGGVHLVAALGAELIGYELPPLTGVIGLAVTLMCWGWGLANVLRPPALKRVSVPLTKLPEALHGLRIAQLSDIHVGPTVGRRFMDDLVARTNALSPDMIVITGDLVDGSVAMLGDDVAPIFDLSAPLGVYFITGNHELISGVDPWIHYIREGGITVLENEARCLRHNGAHLNLVGVEDWDSERFHRQRHPNLSEALVGVDTEHTTILLAHQPKAAREASLRGVDLQLSGHTHGGQMAPLTVLIYLDQPYRSGLYTIGPTQLYVSEGTGYWGPPIRLGTRSELTLLTLERAP